MGNIAYLRNSAQFANEGSSLSGKIEGIAYTGGVIKQHGPFENLVIDLSTTSVAKQKSPIFRDHVPSQIAGHGEVTITDKIYIKGKLSKKTTYGKEAIELAEDGFDWEMSIGIFDFDIEEVEEAEVNGMTVHNATIFRNGVVREVSLVSLGADGNTKAEVFNIKKGDEMKNIVLTQSQWEKLACACGGSKDSNPEDLAAKLEEEQEAKEEKIKELEDKIDELEDEIKEAKKEEDEDEVSSLRAKIKELEAKLEEEEEKKKKKEEEEQMAARAKSIKDKLAEKKVEFSEDKITEAAKTKEATKMLLGFIDEMAPQKKIRPGFEQSLDLSQDIVKKDDAEALRSAANQLVKDGKAEDFLTALNMLEGK